MYVGPWSRKQFHAQNWLSRLAEDPEFRAGAERVYLEKLASGEITGKISFASDDAD